MSDFTLVPGKKKRLPGRPTEYSPTMCEVVDALEHASSTLTVAHVLGVSRKTVYLWMERYPAFLQSVKEAMERSIDRVEVALFERAIGYEHPEEKIFQYEGEPVKVPTTKRFAPSDLACMFLLKNRRPEHWRDKIEHEVRAEPIQFIMVAPGGKQDVFEAPPAQVEGDVVDVDSEEVDR